MDKKKKILTLVAVVLVGGLAALSATGGISGLQSSSLWIDNGDGTWYWRGWDGQGESFSQILQEYESALVSFKAQLPQKEAALAEAEKNLESSQENINVKNILSRLPQKEAALSMYLTLKNNSSSWIIDLYSCTNNSLYKWKGYRYENPDAYDARYKELGEKITSLNKQLNLEQVQATKKIREATTSTNTQVTEITKAANEASVAPAKKIIELKKELAKAKPADKAKINAEILKLQAQLAELKKTTNAQIAGLKAKLTALTTSTNNALKVSVKQYQDEIKKAQDEKTAMEKNPKCVANVRAYVISNQKIVDQLQAEIVTIKQELETAKQALVPKESVIQGLKQEVEIYNKKIAATEAALAGLKNPKTDWKGQGNDSGGKNNESENNGTQACYDIEGNQYHAGCGEEKNTCADYDREIPENLKEYPDGSSTWTCSRKTSNGECGKVQCRDGWYTDNKGVETITCDYYAEKGFPGCTRQASACMINGDNQRYGDIAGSYNCGGLTCQSNPDNEICEGNGKACGDETIDGPWGETCDDGNRMSGDGCSATCGPETLALYCGDVVISNPNGAGFAEQCDDGNTNNGDGCDQYCMTELGEGEGSTDI
jgi:cysteine-rich repeat protein